MKIGFVGSATGAEDLLDEAVEFLMGDVGVTLLVYLGQDDCIVEAAKRWAKTSDAGELSEGAFLTEVARVAPTATLADLDGLFERDGALTRVEHITRLPPPPARGIEMIGDRIITMVWDKGVLLEEDIANSFLTVYGKSKKALFKRFGPRYFFTPGPLSAGSVAVLEQDEDGFALNLYSPDGVPVSREVLHGGVSAKMTVAP